MYVGLRFRNVPRFGMKREFWTLVSVDNVEISGSGAIFVSYQGYPMPQSEQNTYQ